MAVILIKPWTGNLSKASFQVRPHRFQVTIRFPNNRVAGAHCVNPGRGEGLLKKGTVIWVSKSKKRGRKLKWTWELVKRNGVLVGTNSITANKLVHELLKQKLIKGFRSSRKITPETSCGRKVRLDFEVKLSNGRSHFIEVKNCHLRYPDGYAYFPDSETMRSCRHLRMLRRLIRDGHRASIFVIVQRDDIKGLRPSDFHDLRFAAALRRAADYGVTIRAFAFRPTLDGFIFSREIPVLLAKYPVDKISQWSRRNHHRSGWEFWNKTTK